MDSDRPPVNQRRLEEWEQDLLDHDRPRELHEWEWLLLRDWRQFSHECYAASFVGVTPTSVQEFADWLSSRPSQG